MILLVKGEPLGGKGLKDINECGLWITSPNKKEVIVLIKMDLKYKKQNVWKIIDIRVY